MTKYPPSLTARRWKLSKGKPGVLGVGLLTIGLAIATLWVSSAWFPRRIGGDSWCMRMSHGVFQIAVGPGPEGWTFYTPYAPPPLLSALALEWSWLAKYPSPSASTFNLGIVAGDMPIDAAGQPRWLNISGWALALPPLLMGLWFRLKRNWPIGRCQKCGYDRSGIAPNAHCPECGTTEAPPALTPPKPPTQPTAAPSENR